MGLFQRIFGKRSKLKAIFIDEVGIVSEKKVKFSNNTFSVKSFGEEQSYVVDHNFVTYDRKSKIPVSFYYVNNPNPIHIQHTRNTDVDAIGFKKILDSKTITDLFSDENKSIMTILILLIAANILVSLIIAYFVYKVYAAAGLS